MVSSNTSSSSAMTSSTIVTVDVLLVSFGEKVISSFLAMKSLVSVETKVCVFAVVPDKSVVFLQLNLIQSCVPPPFSEHQPFPPASTSPVPLCIHFLRLLCPIY